MEQSANFYTRVDDKSENKQNTYWSNKASRYLTEYMVNCWRVRCDIIHKMKVGTAEMVERELANKLCC